MSEKEKAEEKISGSAVKHELVSKRVKPEERRPLLSGFVRSGFSVLMRGGERYLVLDCRESIVRGYITSLMAEEFKIASSAASVRSASSGMVSPELPDPQVGNRELMFAESDRVLRALDILCGDTYELRDFSRKMAKNAGAYLRGLFLGCGSASVTLSAADGKKSRGYDLEFALGGEALAAGVAELLSGYGIAPHVRIRGEKHVVYVKGAEAVSDCLALIGADGTVLRVNQAVAFYSVKGDTMRRLNFEMANMDRSLSASGSVADAIRYIEQKRGADFLGKKLAQAARARLEKPDASLAALADELGISKSGLKHRFDKITELAGQLGFKAEER